MQTISRRGFLGTLAAAAAVAPHLQAQTSAPDWGGPVMDTHLHLRPGLDACMTHMKGCGVSHAVLLAGATSTDAVHAMQAKYPGVFWWSASSNVAAPEMEARLTQAIKDGATGLGEMKFHVDADGPEFKHAYALAADLKVPILIHFQEVDHFEGEGRWASGFKRFEAVLKGFPRTTFIGHADAFWANVDARYADDVAYPTGPITRGGLTDKLLGDYANLFGDLSANSCNNALSRDASFTADFLKRHQDKLMFGSDCSCTDGNGGGVSQANNPAAARLSGKCVARETLGVLQRSTTPAIFKKLTWDNAHRVFKLT